jgi:hypothetical protein
LTPLVGPNATRLAELKKAYDPDHVFTATRFQPDQHQKPRSVRKKDLSYRTDRGVCLGVADASVMAVAERLAGLI